MPVNHLQIILLLHAAFGGVFLFLHWQHPARFSRLLGQAWLLEAFRTALLLPEINGLGGWSHHWYTLSDATNLLATWWLLAGCADLARVRLPAWLGRVALGAGVPVILLFRYVLPDLVADRMGLPYLTAFRYCNITELVLLFVPVTAARVTVLVWFYRLWREERLPGAGIAIVFGVPYAVFALAVPLQMYFEYYPAWISFFWFARVLGFSLGLVMLVLSQQMAALRHSEHRLASAQASARLGSWDYDVAGGQAAWSVALFRLLGRDPAAGPLDWSGLTASLHPDDRAEFTRLADLARTELRPTAGEHRLLQPETPATWVECRHDPVTGPGGRLLRLTGTMQDITARKRAEARLREQAFIIDHAPFAIVITDLAHRITYANEGAARLQGLTRDQLLGRTAEQAFSPTAMAKIVAGREITLATGRWQGEVPLTTPDGSARIVEYYMSLIRDDRDRVIARLSIGVDVTEKKQIAEQLLRSQRMEHLGLLVAGIAHDLNNILSPSLLVAPFMRPLVTKPSEHAFLDSVERSAERGAALVKQIMLFAQGRGEGHIPVKPGSLARELVSLVRETFPRSLTFEEHIAADLWPVNANPTQLHQVLLNLLVNARDALNGHGVLTLRLTNRSLDDAAADRIAGARPGAYVCFEIGDTGPGIPPEVLPRIWEPFFTTKEPGKGTGLGLSTVRGIVSSHLGFCEVQTAPGEGTVFRVYLPAATAADDHTPRSAHPFLPRAHGELILVVDDEPGVRELLNAVLVNHGYQVLTARDGIEGINIFSAQQAQVALVITDMQMPHGRGDSFAGLLRLIRPDIRVLYISGLSAEESGRPPQAAGTEDPFLLKPFKPAVLLAAVHKLLHPDALVNP
ncbi:Blue-light-activated protein [Lacunisphaera limnophila]|uniref:histidine kinase n=1 Tax=Lacunisphaera limnophila TaxID=1838286 RepID=A0A1D8ASS2_9BACT|nr:ATP-binding protein [Lacunisphaera limnophila]AOS43943.1 Blue-light-activated protein [Lacunisphaera limnophila]